MAISTISSSSSSSSSLSSRSSIKIISSIIVVIIVLLSDRFRVLEVEREQLHEEDRPDVEHAKEQDLYVVLVYLCLLIFVFLFVCIS